MLILTRRCCEKEKRYNRKGPPHGAALCLRLFVFVILYQFKDAERQSGEQENQIDSERAGSL